MTDNSITEMIIKSYIELVTIIKLEFLGSQGMPLYDFKCNTCSEIVETNENIPPVCSTCSGTMQRIWTAPGIKFNSPGFYSTGG